MRQSDAESRVSVRLAQDAPAGGAQTGGGMLERVVMRLAEERVQEWVIWWKIEGTGKEDEASLEEWESALII